MKKKFKNALITGAGKRIGSEIAYSLCSYGWNVVFKRIFDFVFAFRLRPRNGLWMY